MREPTIQVDCCEHVFAARDHDAIDNGCHGDWTLELIVDAIGVVVFIPMFLGVFVVFHTTFQTYRHFLRCEVHV